MLSLFACCRLSEWYVYEQRWFERQLLVVFAQLAQLEQRVELELQFEQSEHEQQQSQQRFPGSASVPVGWVRDLTSSFRGKQFPLFLCHIK